MQLTKDFRLEEFRSPDNPVIPSDIRSNLMVLCKFVLQPLRDYMGTPVTITSGYRTAAHNAAVGGVKSSHHRRGMAADIVTSDNRKAFEFIKNNCSFTQLIDEHNLRWIHVSYDGNDLRNQVLAL